MKIRAIVLDDDYTVRTVISDILKDRGYEVFNSSEPTFCHIYLDSKCPCPDEYMSGKVRLEKISYYEYRHVIKKLKGKNRYEINPHSSEINKKLLF